MTNEEIAKKLTEENEEFNKLNEDHRQLNERIATIDKKKFLTPEEGTERKKLQKQKLSKKDQIADMIRNYSA